MCVSFWIMNKYQIIYIVPHLSCTIMKAVLLWIYSDTCYDMKGTRKIFLFPIHLVSIFLKAIFSVGVMVRANTKINGISNIFRLWRSNLRVYIRVAEHILFFQTKLITYLIKSIFIFKIFFKDNGRQRKQFSISYMKQ